jgi:PPK2 family polyphosphate:nucleotide phosphotransferase
MSTVKLRHIGTAPPDGMHKDACKKELAVLQESIADLQNVLYAESKHSLLIILQGMDASGKDGAIKKVFEPVNPMGCRVFSFKEPTELEMKHDFLWRAHTNVPEKGMIHIFNRSYYEGVLVERVHQWIDKKTVQARFKHINHFEKLLLDSNTSMLKFYLHVSKDEQMKRIRERLKDPTKMWKYNKRDLKERNHWHEYMKAYEDMVNHCSQPVVWNIIPSDHNWYKEYLIAVKVEKTLRDLKMKYPKLKK